MTGAPCEVNVLLLASAAPCGSRGLFGNRQPSMYIRWAKRANPSGASHPTPGSAGPITYLTLPDAALGHTATERGRIVRREMLREHRRPPGALPVYPGTACCCYTAPTTALRGLASAGPATAIIAPSASSRTTGARTMRCIESLSRRPGPTAAVERSLKAGRTARSGEGPRYCRSSTTIDPLAGRGDCHGRGRPRAAGARGRDWPVPLVEPAQCNCPAAGIGNPGQGRRRCRTDVLTQSASNALDPPAEPRCDGPCPGRHGAVGSLQTDSPPSGGEPTSRITRSARPSHLQS
jgi:hypothetical protein